MNRMQPVVGTCNVIFRFCQILEDLVSVSGSKWYENLCSENFVFQ